MFLSIRLTLALGLLLSAYGAAAQDNLGQLLDAGARKLTPEQFKEEVVQRVVVGPSASGGAVELMFVSTGRIEGMGSFSGAQEKLMAPLSGEWSIDSLGRVCAAMRMGSAPGSFGVLGVALPTRCQSWFKLADAYFIADSDSDRQAKVLRRTYKQ